MLKDHIPDLTMEQFERFADFIKKEVYIHLKPIKISLLTNRLRKRLFALNLTSFDDYYDYLINDESGEEIVFFLEVVTTNESYFFRNTQNFEMLKKDLLPDLLSNYRGKVLRFWTAGCSTGEEPYNLAIELIEGMIGCGFFDFNIRASDISRRVVEFAKQGKYSGRKIDKIPEKILSRYFKKEAGEEGFYTVRKDLKSKIEFHVENLFHAQMEPVHCIFCRNVLIYFNQEDQTKLAHHFYDLLLPGGYLVIGHAESLHTLKTPFLFKTLPTGTVYYKKS